MSLFDLCQNWIPAYTGKDRVVVSVGVAALLWSIWKTRNKAYFQSTLPRDPTDVIFNKKVVLSMLKEVTKRLAKVVCDVYSRSHGWGPAVRRIK
ncbi:hypothetical protein ZWY2020_039742 [Hordeum vulgare]|nr:hypothetical protein ZWY2020_039742 [Hordeum vulgare]